MLFAEAPFQQVDLRNGSLRYFEDFIPEHQSLLEPLKTALDWYQGDVQLFGRHYKTPRLQCWYGDEAYTYSNVRLEPRTWADMLLPLKHAVEQGSGYRFNSMLGNWYQHGQHGMGFHADNEPELGQNPVVAMLTFGYARDLRFKHKNGQDQFTITPQSGSLLVMEGETQHYWRHGIAKSARQMGERISLTFRYILPPSKP
ncbi:alpha-ketoglutarate-dependent dioxygenase AlkB family protein [Gynuella sunshinyii]|uniref:Alkylated DNA repair protein n=1 Tax=Gynuella sunshinyii YC6258 TaxID=1445510 RepID=A0A0C5VBZ4_9GAMM|nr:alpha-ketoglutarate-dependent dioxygenase AlkB [Gynuella sunshinyii]AJQ96870.1 alkylated DNA repair protein [Gynuella sunshinyii YC6258]